MFWDHWHAADFRKWLLAGLTGLNPPTASASGFAPLILRDDEEIHLQLRDFFASLSEHARNEFRAGLNESITVWRPELYAAATLTQLITLCRVTATQDAVATLRLLVRSPFLRALSAADLLEVKASVVNCLCALNTNRKATSAIEFLFFDDSMSLSTLSQLFVALCETHPNRFPEFVLQLTGRGWQQANRYRSRVIRQAVKKLGTKSIAARVHHVFEAVAFGPVKPMWFLDELFAMETGSPLVLLQDATERLTFYTAERAAHRASAQKLVLPKAWSREPRLIELLDKVWWQSTMSREEDRDQLLFAPPLAIETLSLILKEEQSGQPYALIDDYSTRPD